MNVGAENDNLRNVAIAVEPVVVPPPNSYELPPVMAIARYGALFPHVAQRSKDLLHILVHGASNLPFIDGRPPRCYVTAQSRSTMATQDIGETINATNVLNGISPHWNEMIYADILEETNHSEEIIILIIDEPHQRTIAEHRFPWRWLEPFYQYHINLQHTLKQTSQTTSLYISIMRKQSSLSKEDIRYFGLEILLNRFESPLPKNEVLYAVARVVPDYETYKHDYLRNLDNPYLGIDFKKIVLPSAQDFNIAHYTFTGYPQLSLASKESQLPTWMYNYLFSHENEKDNMFSNNAALVIEFYPFQAIANNPNWFIRGLVGWLAIRLDARAYDALTAPGSVDGMRTDGLLVESEGELAAENAKYLTAEVLLRIISERHPAKNLVGFAASNLPILPSYYVEGVRQGGAPPVYIQVVSPDKSLLPAIQTTQPVLTSPPPVGVPPMLVPQFYQPSVQSFDRSDGVHFHVPRVNQYDTSDIPSEFRSIIPVNYPPRRDDDIDGWFDFFQRDVANYQQAIRRVIKEAVQLRDQLQIITAANHDLKVRIDNFDKKKKVLYEIFEGDKLDKEKIRDIFNRLSAKISAQTLELKENYGKITNYEKELARKAELRTQYETLSKVVQSREMELRLINERLVKAGGLEETVRHQEIVIEKLESMINNYMNQKRSRGLFNDVDRAFVSQQAALSYESQRRILDQQSSLMDRSGLMDRSILIDQQGTSDRTGLVDRSIVTEKPVGETRTVVNEQHHTDDHLHVHDHHHHTHDHRCPVHRGQPRRTSAKVTKKEETTVRRDDVTQKRDDAARKREDAARQKEDAARARQDAARREELTRQQADLKRQREALDRQRDDLTRKNLVYQQELAHLRARFQENAAAWGREKAELIQKINDIDQP